MSQNYTWPSVSVQATNPSVDLNGASPSAASSTLVAGQNPSGDQQPLQTNVSGDILAEVTSSVLPTGAATAANQTLEITQLTGIHTDTTALNGKTVHVDTGAVVVASSALPSGASTSSLQTSGNSSLTSLDGKTVHVDTGAVVIASSALPSGGATSALQTAGNASLASIDSKTPALGQALAAASTPVVLTAAQVSTLSALPTGAATEATLGQINVSSAQTAGNTAALTLLAGTTTAGSTGPMILGSVTAAAPTYATGQLHPINLTTAGRVRVDGSGTTQPVSQSGSWATAAATPTALTVTQAAIAVGTVAVRLTVSGSAPSATRVVLVATPDDASSAKFYIGSSSVTSSGATRGVQIVAGDKFVANSDAGDYYIISDTAAQTCYVMEQS